MDSWVSDIKRGRGCVETPQGSTRHGGDEDHAAGDQHVFAYAQLSNCVALKTRPTCASPPCLSTRYVMHIVMPSAVWVHIISAKAGEYAYKRSQRSVKYAQ